jgi:hypothetical protein
LRLPNAEVYSLQHIRLTSDYKSICIIIKEKRPSPPKEIRPFSSAYLFISGQYVPVRELRAVQYSR